MTSQSGSRRARWASSWASIPSCCSSVRPARARGGRQISGPRRPSATGTGTPRRAGEPDVAVEPGLRGQRAERERSVPPPLAAGAAAGCGAAGASGRSARSRKRRPAPTRRGSAPRERAARGARRRRRASSAEPARTAEPRCGPSDRLHRSGGRLIHHGHPPARPGDSSVPPAAPSRRRAAARR